jgi:glycosyltransferase involved in cell wall biosynthesis
MYPQETGATVRTLNLARLGSPGFGETTIFAVDNHTEYQGPYRGVNVVQTKKIRGIAGKYIYYLNAYLRRNFVPAYPPQAFEGRGKNTVYQIEGPYYYPLLRKYNVKKYVLDEHNVYWELHRFPAYYSLKNKVYYKMTNRRELKNEIMALENATHILVCSERDQGLILERVPSAAGRISVIPNCVDYEGYEGYARQYVPEPGPSPKVLFVGTYAYDPNIDALYTICQVIAPRVGPRIQLVAVGSNPPAIPHPDNVVFTGYVEDLKKMILDCDVCIAPIRYGSGTRFKILEYMAMGKPVIATAKGAEGIDYTDGEDIIIENDLVKFPDRIRELVEDRARMDRIGAAASRLIRDKYSWSRYQADLRRIYESVAHEN